MVEAGRKIGIIGGSGISELVEASTRRLHRVATPWGAPSGPVESGTVGGVEVLFLPRHGPGHSIPPHRVNYRANLDALRSLGAETIVTVSSVGSLKEDLPPGRFVLPNQFVDLTKQRPTTFYDGGQVFHVSLADPFCPRVLRAAADAGRATDSPFAEDKTYVCIEGPRFSTRAESRWFRSFADVIGMTLVPEVTLARERALCYVCLAMVTDFDTWAERAVEAREITETMEKNVGRMRAVLSALLPKIAGRRDCPCSGSLEHAAL
ncbi:MAG: S-methyl-5'-thioadenosine phosphorylase [Thermoplasmata archaeon]|nr:S-methyl-5'-thioadenosine phosphorylase [Thermoplasmata archaeon]MCI4359719.1 S-methyl-5'-thioadenosine phosphorylase [Thermoplasmata archaeon]